MTVTSLNSSSLKVAWSSDSTPHPLYTVRYHPTPTADPTQLEAWPEATHPRLSPLVVILEGLLPFTSYSVIVVASGLCGSVSSAVVIGLTLQSISLPPLDFTIAAVLPTRVKVQWDSPDSPNGIITEYNVSLLKPV